MYRNQAKVMITWIATFENPGDPSDRRTVEVLAHTQDGAELALEQTQLPFSPTYVFCSLKKKRGGLRKNAGRPKGSGQYGEETVALRVPVSLASRLPKIQSILSLIEDYRIRSLDASSSSPRWEQLRLFLSDVDAIENEGVEQMSDSPKFYFEGTEVQVLAQSEDGSKSVIQYLSRNGSPGRTSEVKTSQLIKGN
jgi:hypothetical protein